MKKIISSFLIVSILFSFRIPATQAAAPALGLVGAFAIGATVLTIGGTQYAQKAGGSYSFNGSHLTREMIAYSNSAITKQTIDQIAAAQGLAHQAGGYFLGKAVTAIFDAQKAYNSDVLKGYNNVYGVAKSVFNNNDNLHIPKVDDVLSPDDLNNLYGIDKPSCGNLKVSNIVHRANTCINNKPEPFLVNCTSIRLFVVDSEKCYPSIPTSVYGHYIYIDLSSTTSDPTDIPSNLPESINPEQATDLSRELEIAISSNPQVASELDDLMKDHPELWAFPDAASLPENTAPGTNIEDYPPVWPITPPQIQQWSAASSIAAQQALVDALQAKVDANPNDLGLQTSLSQAKSKLEQMQATSVGDLAQAEQLEAEKAKDLEISEPAVPEPELKSINLNPIKETQGIMMNKFPFSMLGAVGSMFSVLVAAPQAPSFVIDLGFTQATIDLSSVDNFASNIRAVMSFLIYGLCAFVCLRIWSRF